MTKQEAINILLDHFSAGFVRTIEDALNKEWVGLIDEDMKDQKTHNLDFILGARWAEEILKERNK